MFAVYIGCAVLGGLAVLVRGTVYFRVSLNTRAFVHQIKKLVAANNAARAIKLCDAAPHAPIATITKTMLELHIAGAGRDDLRAVFDASYTKLVVRFTQGALLTNMALGLSAVLLTLPSDETGIPLQQGLIAPAGIAAIAVLLTMNFRRLRKEIGEAGEELVAAMSESTDSVAR